MRTTVVTVVALLMLATTSFAQELSDIDRRLRALEEKVGKIQQPAPDVAELQRQIEILTREIEGLKSSEHKAVAEADTQQYGLGAAASKVYRADAGVSFGGYGEFLYQNFAPSGALARQNAPKDSADLLRAVVYTGYKFNKSVLFNSELEVEHASTESGGAVSMEFAYLDYLLRPQANIRAGVILLPMGLINEQHEPTAYLGARRPEVETKIIPATWSELGAGLFGDVGPLSYRAYVVTGLNSAHIDAVNGIRESRQAGGQAVAEDFAVVGRTDWHPFEGTLFGGSLYSGDSGQSADLTSGRRLRGRVTLGEVHFDTKLRGASFRGLWARGTVGDAARINEANGLTGSQSVGSSFGGWYLEGGYELGSFAGRRELSIAPYLRYERLDTQRTVPRGFERDPANDQSLLTLGLAVKPIPQTVLKIDWQKRTNRLRTGVNQYNVALGYIF